MSTRINVSGKNARWVRRTDNLTAICEPTVYTSHNFTGLHCLLRGYPYFTFIIIILLLRISGFLDFLKSSRIVNTRNHNVSETLSKRPNRVVVSPLI
jgi:hypothetical protein